MGQQAQPELNVTLLLGGGHSRSLKMAPNDPLLRALLASLEERGSDAPRATARPYHLRVDGGRQSFLFSPRDLVGLVIDPPIVLRDAPPQGTVPALSPSLAALPAGAVESRYLLVENFLEPAIHTELIQFALAAEGQFVDSTVSTGDADYRRSKVLYDFPRFAEIFRTRLAGLAPSLVERFGIPPFPVADVECQMTAHNEGNYFKLHNDNGSPDTVTRALTYVYYFHNEPRNFSGGDLRLYHSRVENGAYHCGAHAADIPPKNNSILFFLPHCHHEVLPVRCPSGRFADNRFTINGWLRRPAA